jgi:hypothetical protein
MLRVFAGGSRSDMTPDACLIVLFALLTVTAYLLWVRDALPRLRRILGALAFASLVAAVVLHDLEDSWIASSERDPTPPAAATEVAPANAGGAGA